MNITYRVLLPHESKNYRTIRLESLEQFPESFGAVYQEALQIEKFRMESDIENQTQNRFMVGAFSDDELIGICAFVKEEDHKGSIYQMYVKENFQGKNIGFGLIQAVIGEACERFPDITILLEVTDKNEKAYNLYRKIGFIDVIDTGGKENSGNTQLYLHTANKLD